MTKENPGSIVVQRQIFLSEAEVKYRIPVNRIREILSTEFGGFSPDDIPDYERRLAYISSQILMPVPEPSYDGYNFIPDEKCPICGSRIYYDATWNNKISRTPGWRCEEGGLLHHLQWRANNIMRIKGQTPYFKEVINAGSS